VALIAILAVIGVAVVLLNATGRGNLLGGNLSTSDIMGYAAAAGFSGSDLNVAVAVALAESSGNPAAVGDTNIPGGSVGLWQINLKAHPEFAGQDLTDPQTNADAAFAVYSAAGNSFAPWSTFKSGAYLAYMPTDASGTIAG
jgi:Lysozyme like domain